MMKATSRQVNGITVLDLSGRITLGEGSVVLRDCLWRPVNLLLDWLRFASPVDLVIPPPLVGVAVSCAEDGGSPLV